MSDDNDLPDERGQNGYLAAQLVRLERMLEEHAARMSVIERQLGIQRAAGSTARPFGQGTSADAPTRQAQTHTPREETLLPSWPSVTDTSADETTSPVAPPSVTADEQARAAHTTATTTPPARDAGAAATAAVKKTRGDLEWLIGARVAGWFGIVAVIVSVSFFLKLAFDRQLIGPTGRVMLGGIAGCALLALAERLRLRGYQAYAHVLSGGGIVILYLSVYAAYNFYHLTGQLPAFVLMAIVTATAVALAARYDAYAIAILGTVGGFMTPKLLATNVDNEVGLFGYVALLNAGVLALAYFKRWRSLNYLAFAATWVMFAGWAFRFYEEPKLWLTLFFLTLFFVMFAALALIHNVLKERPARWFDISLILMNATLYFATSYLLLEEHRTRTAATFSPQGPHALLLAAFFVLLYFVARLKHRADKLLTYTYVGLAVTFLTIAVSIQLAQQWITIGWAIEALMLTWIGLKAEEDAPRFAALPVFAVAVMHWFMLDMQEFAYQPWQPDAVFHPLFNKRAVSCFVLIGVCAGIAWLYRRYAARVDERDRAILTSLFVLAGNVLAVTLLTADLNDYFLQRITHADGSLAEVVLMLANTQQFSLTVLWTLYATTAFVVGLRLRQAAVRYGALVLLAVAGAKILTEDARYYDAIWHTPLFNQTAAAFALYVIALWLVAHLYARAGAALATEAARVVSIVTVIGNVFALTGLSLEASGYFAAQRDVGAVAAGQLRDLRLARQLSLSVLWALYGGAMLVMGLVRHNRLLRLMALALLGITTAKVFLFDLSSLDKVYRIISFIVLGAILLAVSFLYQQRQQRAARAEGS